MTLASTPAQGEQTPGPWEVLEHSWQYTSVRAPFPRNLTVCAIDLEDYGVNEDNQTELERIAHANARLIAAAPDLLAACKAARAFGLDDFRPGEQAVYDQLDAAIAKATGHE